MKLVISLIFSVLLLSLTSLEAQQQKENPLAYWLKEHIPAQYPGVEVVDHVDWFQATIPKLDLVVSWALLPQEKLALKEVEGLYEDKRAYTGTKAICVFGFYEKGDHEKISKFIESRLEAPFKLAE